MSLNELAEKVDQDVREAAAALIEAYWAGSDSAMMKLAASYRAGHGQGAFVRAFAAMKAAGRQQGLREALAAVKAEYAPQPCREAITALIEGEGE